MRRKQMRNQIEPDVKKISTPDEAAGLCAELIETTADLISVLEQETQLVRKPASDDFAALTARKHALSITLMRNMELLKHNAEYIKTVASDQLQVLKEQQTQFTRSLEVNHSAISAMKAVSEGLLQTIADKAAKKKSGPEVYTREAGLTNSLEKKSGPISIDTTL